MIVEQAILIRLQFRFMPLWNLDDVDLKLGLFTTNSVSELGDNWMGDGNSFGECIVPSLDRIVGSRQTHTDSVMDIPQRDWKHRFLSAGS
jgi:hypothetical protein